jgi:hypothetical protein
MRIRTGVATLALAGCAVLAAGCGGSHTTGKATSPGIGPADNSATVLVAAAEPLHATSYRFTTTAGGVNAEGAADPATKTVTLTTAGSASVLVVGGEFYVKYPKGMPGADKLGDGRWLHLDASKVSLGKIGVQDPADPAGASGYLKSAASVQKVGDRHYKGTLDLTKSGFSPKIVESLGDSAKAVPFDATLDDKGRLATMDTTLKINGTDVTTHTTLSDYGTKVTATRPAASEVVEAPESFYRIFNH